MMLGAKLKNLPQSGGLKPLLPQQTETCIHLTKCFHAGGSTLPVTTLYGRQCPVTVLLGWQYPNYVTMPGNARVGPQSPLTTFCGPQ